MVGGREILERGNVSIHDRDSWSGRFPEVAVKFNDEKMEKLQRDGNDALSKIAEGKIFSV